MDATVLEPVGVRCRGLSLADRDPGTVTLLSELLARHGVVVVRDEEIDDVAFLGFLRAFGELTFTVGETPVEGFADLNVVSNVGRTTPPRSTFHVDTSYVATPPRYTALRAVTVPVEGGATVFTNQYRAHDTLPDAVRERLEGRTVTHVVTGLGDLPDDAETSAEHPVLRPHPVTGRRALYLTTPKRCAGISGMDPDAAAEMIDYLYAHSTRDDNTYRHAWSEGDVVMWDNAVVLHKADHDGVVGDRVMHRGMVAG